jgi:hypothetical protein
LVRIEGLSDMTKYVQNGRFTAPTNGQLKTIQK